jgi:hypothetical protein
MKNKLHKLRKLNQTEVRLLLESYLLLGLIRLGLWLLPFGSLKKILDKISSDRLTDKLPIFVQMEQIVALVN